MKQETIQQSREQLEKAFASLGKQNTSSSHTLYVILFAVAMLIIGAIIGGLVAHYMTQSGEDVSTQDSIVSTAQNLKNQIISIDSVGQVSLNINDTTHYYTVRKDSVK